MAAIIWIIFGLGAAAFVAVRANATSWLPETMAGIALGTTVGVLATAFSLVSLKKLARKPDGTALQAHMMASFGIKLVAAVAMALVIEFTASKSGPWADLEACLVSFIAVVFFGFAWQGNLIEAASGSNGVDSHHAESPQNGQQKT